MAREAFEREIRQLHDELLVLGSMVERALPEAVRALKYRDHKRSRRLIDDDRLYEQVYRELISYVLDDRSAIQQSNYLLWAAHNLERAADRVTNICERVVFTCTGRLVEMDQEESLESLG